VAINGEMELLFVTGKIVDNVSRAAANGVTLKRGMGTAMGSVREITLGFQLTYGFETRRTRLFPRHRQTLI